MLFSPIRLAGDAVLRQKCTPIAQVDESTRKSLEKMTKVLHKSKNGAALAAPQIGITQRLVVIDMGTGLIQLVNPEIIHQEGKQEVVEGCLSIPETWGKLIRPAKVVVRALNENGKEITIEGVGDMAKCLCHEIDHLDGVLFTDHVFEYVD